MVGQFCFCHVPLQSWLQKFAQYLWDNFKEPGSWQGQLRIWAYFVIDIWRLMCLAFLAPYNQSMTLPDPFFLISEISS